jgi:hypothetical protein
MKNKWIIDLIKGEPNSLTSTAYQTGEVLERQRIIKLITNNQTLSTQQLINLINGENNE